MKRLMKLSIVGEIENILMKVMMAWSWIGTDSGDGLRVDATDVFRESNSDLAVERPRVGDAAQEDVIEERPLLDHSEPDAECRSSWPNDKGLRSLADRGTDCVLIFMLDRCVLGVLESPVSTRGLTWLKRAFNADSESVAGAVANSFAYPSDRY